MNRIEKSLSRGGAALSATLVTAAFAWMFVQSSATVWLL
jgi:hypothetical protein